MKKFLLDSLRGKIVVDAHSFEVTELGAYFYKYQGPKPVLVAFYPIAGIISITEIVDEGKPEQTV